MSLLCGFVGERDDVKLSALVKQSRHAGLGTVTHYSFGSMHFSYAADACSTALTGVAISADGQSMIAIVGMPQCDGCQRVEDLLRKLEQDGLELLHQLRGSYVGMIHYAGTSHWFRDKSGRRTLFYEQRSGNIQCFATEARMIHQASEFSPEILPSSVAQYLTYSYIPGENTMLRGLKELKAGCVLNAKNGQQIRYFKPELESSIRLKSEDEWIEEFRNRLFDSITRACPNQSGNHAVFLSGGIDSSIVTAALAQKYGSEKVKAFGIHFGKKYPHELEHIRAVAQHTGVECEEVEVNPKSFLPYLHDIVASLNDPIGDPVTMPNYLLANHIAAQGYHGVFNGEGGDPIFGGPKNMTMLLHHWYETGKETDRAKAYLTSYRRGYEEIEYLLTPEWQAKINAERDLESPISPMLHTTQPESFLKKLLLINMRQKGAHLILPKVERMLGAHGITPLSPLFDESLIELCMQLPGDLILKNGIEKVILKRAFADDLPSSIIDRPKSGMRVPVHYWFKGEMKRYARKILSKKRLNQTGIFNPDRVKQLLKYATQEGQGRYGIKLWMLLTFEIWREQIFGE